MPRAVLLAVSSLLFAIAAFAQTATAPDLILVKGKVWTGEASPQWAEAIAISGDRISAVGKTSEITALAGPGTRKIDLGGRLVIPGLNDAHVHQGANFPAFHLAHGGIDPSWAQIEAAILAARDETASDQWIVGTIGPSILADPSINRAKLDALGGGRKVWLNLFTGHASIASSAALRAFGIEDTAADPPGGWYEREPGTNRVNGRSYEYAQYALYRRAEELVSEAEAVADLRDFSATAVQYGITSIQNMPMLHWDAYRKLAARAEVPLRIRIIRFPMNEKEVANVTAATGLPPNVTLTGTKWIVDGTPAERNSGVRREYKGGGKGRLNFEGAALDSIIRRAAASDEQLLLHVSGDRTVESVLRAMEAAGIDWREKRVRFEHGDGVMDDLIARAAKQGVVIVQNPSHFEAKPLFPEGNWFAVKSIVGAGVPFALGSDGLLNPFANIALAVSHRANAREALTREQAVAAYTRGSAFAERMEKEKGTIARGKLADIAVLSQDVFTVPVEQIPETRSVLTIIGGKVVHDAR